MTTATSEAAADMLRRHSLGDPDVLENPTA